MEQNCFFRRIRVMRSQCLINHHMLVIGLQGTAVFTDRSFSVFGHLLVYSQKDIRIGVTAAALIKQFVKLAVQILDVLRAVVPLLVDIVALPAAHP